MSAPSPTAGRTLVSIQYLRALAALAVVVYHAFQRAHVEQMTSTELQVGGAGVDVFFVVSGFVMWATTDRAPVSPLEFLRRRLVRIAPPYWLATGLAMLLVTLWPWVFQEFVIGDWRNVAESLLFISHRNPKGVVFPLLQQGWTLNYEMVFYLLFAVGLVMRPAWRLTWITLTLGALWVAGVTWPPAYPFLCNPMLMEFAAGVLLAVAWRRGWLRGRVWPWFAIVYGVAAYVGLQAIDYQSELWRPLLWGAPATLIVGGAVALETAGWGRPWPWLERLGDASYALYLFHPFPAAVIARAAWFSSAWVFIPVTVVACVATGLVARALIEKPLLKLMHGTVRAHLPKGAVSPAASPAARP